jgi:hypothetical protein
MTATRSRDDRYGSMPISRTALLLACSILGFAVPSIAADQQRWTCTWPGFSADRAPVIVRFSRDQNDLVESDFGLHYRILQDNDFGLIAVWSIAEIEHGHAEPSIGTMTLVINKKSGALVRANALLDEPDAVNQPTHGRCIAG